MKYIFSIAAMLFNIGLSSALASPSAPSQLAPAAFFILPGVYKAGSEKEAFRYEVKVRSEGRIHDSSSKDWLRVRVDGFENKKVQYLEFYFNPTTSEARFLSDTYGKRAPYTVKRSMELAEKVELVRGSTGQPILETLQFRLGSNWYPHDMQVTLKVDMQTRQLVSVQGVKKTVKFGYSNGMHSGPIKNVTETVTAPTHLLLVQE